MSDGVRSQTRIGVICCGAARHASPQVGGSLAVRAVVILAASALSPRRHRASALAIRAGVAASTRPRYAIASSTTRRSCPGIAVDTINDGRKERFGTGIMPPSIREDDCGKQLFHDIQSGQAFRSIKTDLRLARDPLCLSLGESHSPARRKPKRVDFLVVARVIQWAAIMFIAISNACMPSKPYAVPFQGPPAKVYNICKHIRHCLILSGTSRQYLTGSSCPRLL